MPAPTDETGDESQETDFALPDEVDRHGPVEPGIYRIDADSLFGHIADPDRRQKAAAEYADDLKATLPPGSIVLPTDVEHLGHVDDADKIATTDEIEERVQEAMDEARSQAVAEAQYLIDGATDD